MKVEKILNKQSRTRQLRTPYDNGRRVLENRRERERERDVKNQTRGQYSRFPEKIHTRRTEEDTDVE